MKRFFLFALAATAFAACSTDTTQDLAPEIPTAPDELQVSFDEEDTRIQLGENGAPVWTEGDLVSVFYKSDGNDCYKFTGKTGDREGTLKRTSVGEWSRRGDNVVVVYPYSKSYIISLSANTVEASLPAEQTYAKNSYGIGSSLMIATGDYKQFALKNVCGWLKLQFTGTGYVSKIVLRGNNGEQVAGNMLVCADDASCILAEASADIDDDEVGGALITDGDILTSVTLNCGYGVALQKKVATAFYVALPPQTFEKGFTATIYGCDGLTKEISTENLITIERNHIVPMTSAEIKLLPATNQIWYTSSNGKIVKPYATDVFGANITSNTYENGVGVITFDGDVTTIGNWAFWNCSALTSVTIPDSVTTIGEMAFSQCASLESVTIPDSVTTIGFAAFHYCTWLRSVTIPDSVTTIGQAAFDYCRALTSVTIPDSVTKIGDSAFSECSALKTFYGKFASEDNRCLIVDGVLNSFAPAGLTTYSIPDSVTEIVRAAFASCSALTSVTIPDSVTTIGEYAFAYCDALKTVYCKPTTPPSLGGSSVFDNNASGRKIYVYAELLDAYKAASYWSEYADSIYSMGNYQTTTILYTTSDGQLINTSTLPIKSNTYQNGIGKMVVCGTLSTIPEEAFYNCDALTSITIPDSVTTIGSSAFNHCDALTSVTIGNSVTTIGEMAFYNCDALTSVTIPDSVTTIREYAFDDCDALTSVTIGDSVTEIGDYAFYNCDVLKAFYGKFASADNRCWIIDGVLKCFAPAGLTTYSIPDSVTTIGVSAFYDCDALTSVTIPDSVTTIGNYAFTWCSSLKSVTIPDSVTTIGEGAFYGCDALKEVYCKPTTPPIADKGSSSYWKAFDYNASGRKIYVPTASVDVYKAASGWKEYADAIVAMPIPSNQIWYTSSDGNVIEPHKTDVFGANITSNTYENGVGVITFDGDVTTIGYAAFYNCSALTSVTIPDSVTTIEMYAFRNCSALTSVTIPDSVTTIGNSAFYDCYALTSVTIPDSVTTIRDDAFFGCNALTGVTIPDSVTTIGSRAFAYCDALKAFYGKFASEDNRCLIIDGVLKCFAPAGLTTYSIPDSVTTIGEMAFSNCDALTSVTIPDSVTTIGNYAFAYCDALTSVTIGNSVTTIGNEAFTYCRALTSVTIGNSVTTIGNYAFTYCNALKSITIPDSVTTIGEGAFGGCDALTSVTIPDSVTTIGNSAFGICSKLTAFYGKFASADNRCLIVDGVLNAFAIGCGLTEYTIPDSVTTIGNSAFSHCTSLTSVTIPDSVTMIGDYAFRNCTSLKEVYCKPTTPPSLGGSYVFDGNASDRKIYVPTASVDAYKAKQNWSEYADAIEPYNFTE